MYRYKTLPNTAKSPVFAFNLCQLKCKSVWISDQLLKFQCDVEAGEGAVLVYCPDLIVPLLKIGHLPLFIHIISLHHLSK